MINIDLNGVISLGGYQSVHSILTLYHDIPILEEDTDSLFSRTSLVIKFLASFYIEIPTSFSNVKLKSGSIDDLEYVKRKVADFVNPQQNEVFVFDASDKKYYIGARKLIIE